MNENKKMFMQIVKELRVLIREQQIEPGDKLPSERVLSEQLGVGRSSVREALRSLELLGLIETRHGGGTFLASIHHHQLIEILSSFILQETKSIEDVHATREMHEREAIRIICRNESLRTLPVWESLFIKIELQQELMREDILRECIIASANRLALKIWLQLLAYGSQTFKHLVTEREKKALQMFIKSLQMGYIKGAIEAYEEWIEIIQDEL
ncbi:GntR family transcriptional regulator [Metasolibacillus sp. FSL H7-0170]|uniref:FadR/GntR family transcriptional regulator n=1 Tax=Metasolibacillus TaxID=2703677 RepID=UPI000791B38A|nr:GntR family transcriptional regulator [Metasolibacillus fluoroglycofenilyticus]KYG92390.1 GntR family transcriptional regulator [[Bacillus] sp. KCTC 13219]